MKTTTTNNNRLQDIFTQSAIKAVTSPTATEQLTAKANRERATAKANRKPTNYYEHLYLLCDKAVNAVLADRYRQTGVPFYRELNSYHNNATDKAIFMALCEGKNESELKQAKQDIEKKMTEQIKQYNRALKRATDLTATPQERKANAKSLHEHTQLLNEYRAKKRAITTDLELLHKFVNGGYSDRFGLIQSAYVGLIGYDITDFAEKEINNALQVIKGKARNGRECNKLLKRKLRFRAMCKSVGGAMAELCNPATDNTYRNWTIRKVTAEEIKNGFYIMQGKTSVFYKTCGNIGREWKYYATSIGANQTYYTIEQKQDRQYYLIKHYATTNIYQYMPTVYEGKDSNGNSTGTTTIDIDTALYQANKNFVKYDNYFANDLGELEQLAELMQTANFTEREQLFIKKLSSVAKFYDDSKTVIDIAMRRMNITTDGAKRTFLCRLREKLTKSGYTYRQHTPHNRQHTMPYNKAVKVAEGKRVDLLKWCEIQPIKADFTKCVEWVQSAEKCERVTPPPKAEPKKCIVLWTLFEKVDKTKSNGALMPTLSATITMSPTANIFNGKAEINRTYTDGFQTYTVIDID